MIGIILLLTIALMALVFVLLGIRILIKKNGRFSMSHVGGNKYLAKQGIRCANTQDREDRVSRMRRELEDEISSCC